ASSGLKLPPVPPAEQMSGFELRPVSGGAPVQLPPGETVLGRGPLLGISDKRVSRLHGLLENLNGQLRLKPTHLNPCFVQSSLTDDPRPLQRDSWYPLHHGDFFSLLPGQFVYRVVETEEEDRTPRNSQMFEEEEEEEDVPLSLRPDVEPRPPVGQTPPRRRRTQQQLGQTKLTHKDSEPAEEADDGRSVVAPSVPKRRVLPAWMMAAVAAPHTSSSSSRPKVQSAVKRSKGPAAAPASISTKRAAATPAGTSSPEEVELGERGMPKKRRRKMSDDEEEAAQSKTVSGAVRDTVPRVFQVVPSAAARSELSDDEGRGGETSAAAVNAATRTSASANGDERSKNGGETNKGGESARPKARLRTPCPYGKDCYRKNPIHFQESSHPGDTDYEEEEEEGERPECPYGTDCYRSGVTQLLSPDEREAWKGMMGNLRRTASKKAPVDEDEEDDDSFIDDDSEDAGNDSDYAPPASETTANYKHGSFFFFCSGGAG
ncbi:hypothetical protein L3Q82_020115, partial [Scortum barcoo]